LKRYFKEGQQVSLVKRGGKYCKNKKLKETIYLEGMGRLKVQKFSTGDICALVG